MIDINLPLPLSILYLFTACKLIIQVKYTPVLTFHWDSDPHALLIHGGITPLYLLPTRDIYICGCGSIYCLTAASLLLLTLDKILRSLWGILLFVPFLELLGSEFLQKTPELKPWVI